jgi:hypothetical protein
MIKVYQISYSTQLKNARLLLIHSAMLCFISIVYLFFIGYTDEKVIILFFTIIFLTIIFPAITLHVNYYFLNKKDILEYNLDLKEIIFIHKKAIVQFNLHDITSITSFISFPMARNDFTHMLPYDTYSYVEILLNNKIKITLSSLLINNKELILQFPIEKKVQKRKLFRWVGGQSFRKLN